MPTSGQENDEHQGSQSTQQNLFEKSQLPSTINEPLRAEAPPLVGGGGPL